MTTYTLMCSNGCGTVVSTAEFPDGAPPPDTHPNMCNACAARREAEANAGQQIETPGPAPRWRTWILVAGILTAISGGAYVASSGGAPMVDDAGAVDAGDAGDAP